MNKRNVGRRAIHVSLGSENGRGADRVAALGSTGRVVWNRTLYDRSEDEMDGSQQVS